MSALKRVLSVEKMPSLKRVLSRESIPEALDGHSCELLMARMPRTATALRMFLGCLTIFAMGGVVFGVSSLYEVFYQEQLWGDRCTLMELGNCTASIDNRTSGRWCCSAQAHAVSVASSTAFFAADGSAAIWGEVVDRAGGLVGLSVATLISFVGFLLLGAGVANRQSTPTFVGLLGTGLAAPGVFQSIFVAILRSPIEGTPEWMNVQLATATAASFDLSALVLRLTVLMSHSTAGMATVFVLWAFLSVALALLAAQSIRPLCSACLRPSGPCAPQSSSSSSSDRKHPLEEKLQPTEGSALLPDAAGAGASSSSTLSGWRKAVVDTLCMLCTAHNISLILFMSFYTLAAAFYLQNHSTVFAAAFDNETAENLTSLFDTMFPIGGFAACIAIAPLIAWLRCSVLWAIVGALVLLWFSLTMVMSLEAQYAGCILFGPVRAAVWATFYRSIYAEELYPPRIAGRAIGYACLATGLIGDGLTPTLVAMASPERSLLSSALRNINIAVVVALAVAAIPLPLLTRRAENMWLAAQKP